VPEAVVQPENIASVGAARAVISAIRELGPEWKVRFEGPRAEEKEQRGFPLPDPDQISAVVYVTLAREMVLFAIDLLLNAARRWHRETGHTIEIIVVEKETGERPHTIRMP